jgi:putative endonuclease
MIRSNKNQAYRNRTGRIGERIAAVYLQFHGYHPVARNLRIGRGEIDLLLLKNGVYRIVEVRTTRSVHLPCPTHAITPRKQRQLISLAKQLASKQPYCKHPICIDVIGIRIHSWRFPTIVWLKNAVNENSL